MDNFKKETIKDYTAWDLTHRCHFVKIRNRQRLEAIFKRKARRAAKQRLKKEVKNCDSE